MRTVAASMTAVSGTLTRNKSAKDPAILSTHTNRFSGPWWASSEMSNRSVSSRLIISPVLLRS